MFNIYEVAKPVGDTVVLKKLVPTLDKRYGNIILPHSINKNESMGVAKVIDMGKKAYETGLKKDDYVLYDYYSVYENKMDYVITRVENIILIIDEEQAKEIVNSHVIQGGTYGI